MQSHHAAYLRKAPGFYLTLVGLRHVAKAQQARAAGRHGLECGAPLIGIDGNRLDLPREKWPTRNRQQVQCIWKHIIGDGRRMLRILRSDELAVCCLCLFCHQVTSVIRASWVSNGG